MARKKARGLIRGVYVALLFLFGMVAWLYFHAGLRDYTGISSRFDSSLSALFSGKEASGARHDVTDRRQASRTAVWTEYVHSLDLPKEEEIARAIDEVRAKANDAGLTVIRNISEGKQRILEIGKGNIVLSKLIFRIAPLASQAAAKRFALVIDDVGPSRDISAYLDFGIPVTFAILPHERYSKAVAGQLTERQMPYLLHLPLEPEGFPRVNPGKSALLVGMTEKEMAAKFKSAFLSVPGIRGISNHMGSRFSADERGMSVLLSLVKESGLFYFDSYTSPKSVAGKLAARRGVPGGVNDLFIDLKDDPVFMAKQFDRILAAFDRRNEYIAIGHIQKKHLVPVLKEYIPKFGERGIAFVYLTDLIEGETPAAVARADDGSR